MATSKKSTTSYERVSPGLYRNSTTGVIGPKGALGTDPKGTKTTTPTTTKKTSEFKLGGSLDTLEVQRARTEAELARRGGAAKAGAWADRLASINNAIGNAKYQDMQNQNRLGVEGVNTGVNTGINNAINQYESQGAFNPGDYEAMRQKAEQTAMGSFERSMGSRFKQEEDAFKQEMSDRRIPPDSELYQQQYAQLKQAHNDAYQQANAQAFQLGQGEQAQAYNQQYQTYNAPLQAVSAYSPYYGAQSQANLQQGQQSFEAQQAELQRKFQESMAALQNKYSLQQIAAAPHSSGGGLSLADQIALQNNQFYNNSILGGGNTQQKTPGFGTGFSAGLGSGISAGISAGLK